MKELGSVLRRWAPILAVLAVVLVYVRTLEAPFMWDDRQLVLDSPIVTTLQPLGSYFGRAFWNSPETGEARGYYRPLTILSLALDCHVHGINPGGFHFTNLLLHALNVLLLYFLLRRHRILPAIALGLSLLWALHPRLTEAVAWISGRTDVLATGFVLAALLAYRPHKPLRLLVASLLTFLGLLCKEVAIAGALVLIAMELIADRRPSGVTVPLGRRAAMAALPGTMLLVYLALRHHALSGGPPSAYVLEQTFSQRAILVLAALGSYARMSAVPWMPELQIGDISDPRPLMAATGALTALGIGVLARRFRRALLAPSANVRPLIVMGSALALGGLGLVLQVMPISVNVVAADRFLYLPLVGMALLLAPCLQTWAIGSPRKLLLGGALVVSFFAATHVRVGDWCSEIQLWRKAYRDAPKQDAIPVNELGNVYYRAGLFEEAEAIYAQGIRNGAARHRLAANLADARSQQGDYDGAQRELSELCETYPKIPDYCLDAGLASLHALRFDTARSEIRLALERSGDYPAATAALALIPRVEALLASPGYASSDALTRTAARFDVAVLAGRRPDALKLGEALLASPQAPQEVRRQAVEYWVRFGPPGELGRVLGLGGALDVVDGPILDSAELRIHAADELMRQWSSLGIPKSDASDAGKLL